MKKKIISGVFFLLKTLVALSQTKELLWDFEPGFNYYSPKSVNGSKDFKLPHELNYYWGESGNADLNDVPALHGVSYFFLKNKLKINEKIWVESDLYVEHLGASFDLFNNDIVNIFPLVTLYGKKGLILLGDSIKGNVKYGVLKNHQEFNKITVYGYDIQGLDFKASYKALKLSFTQISQLSFHNLSDPIHQRISYSKKHLKTTFEIGIGKHSDFGRNSIDRYQYNGLDVGINISRDSSLFKIYAQYSSNTYKDFDLLNNLRHNYAAVIGIKGRLKKGRFEINHFVEGRIYTYLFNEKRLASTETIHPQYYFQRDVMTWSRFIELHHATRRDTDILGLNYNLKGNYDIIKGSSVYLKSEIAWFYREGMNTILYPFYNIGYKLKIKNNILEVGLSNKIFVDYLDTPNYALMKNPFLNLSMIRKTNKW